MTKPFQIKPIGTVINEVIEPAGHLQIKSKPSTIILRDVYKDELLNIENCEYLDVIFHFHKSDEWQPTGSSGSGRERGVFASRSPHRPNPIGVTTVKVLDCKDNKLIVEGLDAINETPVLDIKSGDTSLFASESDSNPVHNAILKTDPRIEIRNNIAKNEIEILLIKAGQIHGHFCPGLALGIMAASYAMREKKTHSDGMEDLLAITETNNCFSDGIQFVTGCTFGNNSLIFKDIGKTAFTLTTRDGMGVRIGTKPDSREIIQDAFPDYQELYRKVVAEQNHDPELVSRYKNEAIKRSFGTLTLPFEKIFFIQQVKIRVPDYAPVNESVICADCGESVMKTRTVQRGGAFCCLTCAGLETGMLDGAGVHLKKIVQRS